MTDSPSPPARVVTGRSLLPRFGEDKLCRQRTNEAFQIIDELLAPIDDEPPELWQIARRDVPNGWAPQAGMMLRLCSRVLELGCELAAKASRREQAINDDSDEAACLPSDLHCANFLLPLLSHALHALCDARLSKWQKHVAWHLAQAAASSLSRVLPRPPVAPPAELDGGSTQASVHYAVEQRVALLTDDASRMLGGEGITRLAKIADAASTPQVAESLFGASKIRRAATYDGVSQIVLPWHAPEVRATPSADSRPRRPGAA